MWNENPMKVYAKKHPGCSLQEYCDYLDREEQERRDTKRREEEKREELLKSYVGKCFRINFNGQAFIYFRLTKKFGNSYRVHEDCYEVYIDSKETRVIYSKQRMLNIAWFPGNILYDRSGVECQIIPDEVFENICNYYKEMVNVAPKIRDMKL